MKKMISLLVVLALLTAGMVIAAFATDNTVIAVEKTVAAAGEEVTLEVVITNNPGFAAAKFTVEYDETALTLVGVDTTGCLLEGATENDAKGVVAFAATSNKTEDGVLFTVTFKVNEGVADGAYDVSVTLGKFIQADRTAIAYTVDAGCVNVVHACDLQDVEEVPATCTENGVKAHQKCSLCGKLYVDGVEVTEADLVIEAGHTEGEVKIENEKAATCTEEGSHDEVVYCSVCGEELSRKTVVDEKLAHTEGEVKIENEVPATCTTEGSHDEVVYCSVCGEELSRKTVVDEKLAHTEGEVVIENEKAATCTEEGSYDEVTYCTECEEELSRKTVVTEKLPHSYVDGKCEHCGEEEKSPATGDYAIVAVATALVSMMGIVALTKKKEN